MYDSMKDKTFQVLEVKERFGVFPTKWSKSWGSWGMHRTTSLGFPGIGPKTAAQLIEELGSIEEVLKGADKIKNANSGPPCFVTPNRLD